MPYPTSTRLTIEPPSPIYRGYGGATSMRLALLKNSAGTSQLTEDLIQRNCRLSWMFLPNRLFGAVSGTPSHLVFKVLDDY